VFYGGGSTFPSDEVGEDWWIREMTCWGRSGRCAAKFFGFGSSNVADSSPMVMDVDCLQGFLDFSSSSWLGFVMLVFLDAYLVPFVQLISACFWDL
jgi:hypothetical protein